MAISLNNLASLYYAQGKYAEAEPLLKRTLTIQEKAFGKNHPSVVNFLEGMSVIYKKMGKEAEAKEFKERARRIRSANK